MMNMQVRNGLINERKVVVSFDGQMVKIRRGMFGRTEVSIPVSKITLVGWHKNRVAGGYIEFVAAGADGRVEFMPWSTKEFAALRAAVDAAVAR